MESVAVTGASGFLGSHMVEFLKKKGHWVRAISSSPPLGVPKWGEQADEVLQYNFRQKQNYDNWTGVHSNIGMAIGDVDWVFHFAANHGGVGYISQNEYQVASDNLLSDINVVDYLTGSKPRLFYPSSSCIYPDNDGKPQGVYGYEKLLMTELSKHAPFDMRVGILGTIFGPLQSEGKKAKFPVDICNKVRNSDGKIEIWGDGKQVRTFLYVDDFCEMAYELMSADRYAGPVNIASEDQVTIQEITDTLCEHAGITPQYSYRTDKPSGAQERREDMTEWKKRYKYRPKVTTTEGFRRLYDYLSEKNIQQPPAVDETG